MVNSIVGKEEIEGRSAIGTGVKFGILHLWGSYRRLGVGFEPYD